MEEKREFALKYAWTFIGLPYIWGGDDPILGFDCSGFVIEVLKSVGLLPRKGDWTAHQLYDKFMPNLVEHPRVGCLVFWNGLYGSSRKKIVHVEIVCATGLSLGASGGGSKNRTRQDAIDRNSFIKPRPYHSRSGVAGFVDPFMGVAFSS